MHTLHHYVRVGGFRSGRRVHVTEKFTLRSWLRWPHRGIVLMPGTLATGSVFNLEVDGYRFHDRLAREGFFAFAVDYEGSGESTYPENGLDVDNSVLVEDGRAVVNFARIARFIPKVDVLGESNGGSAAAEMCDDSRRVRSCILSSMLYIEGTPFFDAVFQDPAFVGFLLSQPDGYIQAGPELYFNIVAGLEPELANAILTSQPGLFAVGPLVAPADGLPWFDPTHADVPALIIQGTLDNIATQNDADLLAAAYGSAPGADGVAEVVRVEGAGLVLRFDNQPYAEEWNQIVLDYLDP